MDVVLGVVLAGVSDDSDVNLRDGFLGVPPAVLDESLGVGGKPAAHLSVGLLAESVGHPCRLLLEVCEPALHHLLAEVLQDHLGLSLHDRF